MNAAPRTFEDRPATREGHVTPLIIGITGAQSAGKTWSALRLARGIQRVVGGEIYGIDTEEDRMLHYADYFQFRHVPFAPPHGARDYIAAIDHCANRGARVILIDSMSDEHEGEGGLLDQMEQFLDERAGDDWKKREKLLATSQIEPKRARKKMDRRIRQLSASIVFILCYRAEQKLKFKAGSAPEQLGWQPTTTSKLPFSMTVRFLLAPGSDGVPTLMPTSPAEKLQIKNPEQFRGWFKEGDAISEEMGERMAQWARGGAGAKRGAPTVGSGNKPAEASEFEQLVDCYVKCNDRAAFDALEQRRTAFWSKPSPAGQKPKLKELSDAAAKRIAEAEKPQRQASDPPDPVEWEKNLRAHVDENKAVTDLDAAWQECTRAFGGMVPMPVEDAYNTTREQLIEREARAE